MAIITQYKCDRCGKIWNTTDTTEQIVSISMKLDFGFGSISPLSYSNITQAQQWCRTCVISTGINPPKAREDEAIAPEKPLSTTEILTDLITSLGFVQSN